MRSEMTKLLFLMALMMLALIACTHEADPELVSSETTMTKNVPEPLAAVRAHDLLGADIHFSNDYDGQTAVGELEQFNLYIRSQYPSGSLVIDLIADDGLEIYSDEHCELAITGETLSIPISVQALKPGRYRLKYIAEVVVDGVAGIPAISGMVILVGDDSTSIISQSHEALLLEEADERIISMPAEETIY